MSLQPAFPSVAGVLYTSVRSGGNVTFTLPVVYTSPRSRNEAQPSYGVYKRWVTTFKIDPTVWTLAAGSGVYPKMRDTLVVDGITWTVRRDVDSPAPRGLWRLSCNYLQIDATLQATLQYVTATCTGSSATGSRTVTNTDVGDPIAAAVQPFNAMLGDMFGTKDFEDRYMIYALTDPSGTGPSVINAGDMFRDSNGVLYEIEEVVDRLRLDDLNAYRCVKKL